ncbi:MAG: hypothetical protein ABIS01_12450, partial [Ferruginibacter sp.]
MTYKTFWKSLADLPDAVSKTFTIDPVFQAKSGRHSPSTLSSRRSQAGIYCCAFKCNTLTVLRSVFLSRIPLNAVLIISFACLFNVSELNAQYKQQTYCNPVNIDYGYTPIPNFSEWGRHRATADPVIVTYKGDYYLFSTNQ